MGNLPTYLISALFISSPSAPELAYRGSGTDSILRHLLPPDRVISWQANGISSEPLSRWFGLDKVLWL